MKEHENRITIRARVSLKRRDQAAGAKVVDQLRGLGFANVHQGRYGVSFEGDTDLLQSVFETKIEAVDEGFRFLGDPVLPEHVREESESVYIPTRPIFPGKNKL